MEKNILSEVNRIREIMGIQIISEAPAPPIGFLKKILGNIFDAAGTSTIDIEKVIKNVTDNLSQTEIDNIISKILSKQFNDIALQNIDLNKLFKEVLKQADVNTKKIINQITVDLIKNEFPDIHKSLENVPSQIRGLDGLLNNNQQDVYDKVLKLLYNQKKLIDDAKDLDPNLKKIILDAYGLNSLPTPSSYLPFIKKNKNLLYDTIREQLLLPNNKFGKYVLNNNEKNQLKDFVNDKISFSSLDNDLRDKIIFFLRDNNIKIDGKDKKIIQEYFKNLLLSKGYIKNGKVNEIQFYRDVHNLIKTGMSTSEALDNLIGESDSKLLYRYVNEVIDSFGELEEYIRNAPKETKGSKFKDWIQNYEKSLFNYIKFFRETTVPSLKVLGGEDKFIEETEKKLTTTLSNIARKMDEGQIRTAAGDWDTFWNLVVTLNTSPQKRGAAKKWLDEKLINSKIFTSQKELEKFMQSNDYKDLYEATDAIFEDIWGEYFKRLFFSYSKLVLLNPKWLKITQNKAVVGEIFTDMFKGWKNILIWADPMSVNEMRQLYALMGTKGVLFDKAIKYLGVQLMLVPYLKAAYIQTQVMDEILSARKTLEALKEACNDNLMDEKECDKVNKNLVEIEKRPTTTEIANELRNWMPVLIDSNVDDFVKFIYTWWEAASFKVGIGQATQDVIDNWKSTALPEIERIDTESKKFLDDFAKKYEKYGLEFDTEENIKKSIETLAQIIKNEKDVKDKIGETIEGFEAWASVNGYTVTTPYNAETGIGKAYKNDDPNRTPIGFEWKNNTFKP